MIDTNEACYLACFASSAAWKVDSSALPQQIDNGAGTLMWPLTYIDWYSRLVATRCWRIGGSLNFHPSWWHQQHPFYLGGLAVHMRSQHIGSLSPSKLHSARGLLLRQRNTD